MNTLVGKTLFLLHMLIGLCYVAFAQQNWPKEIPISGGGSITIYKPQPERLEGNKLSGRAAVSVKVSPSSDPVFGAIWADATTSTDRDNRMLMIESLSIKQVKFPGEEDEAKIEKFKRLVESEVPNWNLSISMESITTQLDKSNIKSSSDLKTDPPKIIYASKPSTLVLIEGEPKLEKDKNLGMERVINTPFPIVKDGSKYFLFTGKYWYASSSITSGWSNTTALPSKIKELDTQIKKQMAEDKKKNPTVELPKDEKPTDIVVSTTPAELIQTDGPADYYTLEGTSLLYVSNSPNDLFKDINTQNTYVLITGRWYQAPGLNGPWTYVAPDKLPADFANIEEGGDKDNVLASVAGTDAANEAVLDAMIPQTASVERSTAKPSTAISYDGTPQFEPIQGTSLEIAVNTKNTVMRQNGIYYVVDNGIWFESTNANGPWRVSVKRPTDVENIPASSPAYNTKYVEIYDVRPDVVVVGYTPGYMNSYIYGPTVVYGTGYPYNPWWGGFYYPRPVTWGFGMNYNPWTGWSFNWGFSYSMGPWSMGWGSGGFSFSFGYGYGGWFGPPVYRPPYRPPYWNGGYYRPGGGYNRPNWGNGNNINIGGDVNINIGGNQNIYNRPGNKGITSQTVNRRPGSGNLANNKGTTNNKSRPALPPSTSKPGTSTGTSKLPPKPEARPSLPGTGSRDVITDKSGNVFRRDDNGDWNQQSKGNRWTPPADKSINRDLDRMQRDRDRGNTRDRTFEANRPIMPTRPQARPSTGIGPGMPSTRPSAPAARPAARSAMPSKRG